MSPDDRIRSEASAMTSVRTCYCKQDGNTLRKENNDIEIHRENRPLTANVSRKSIIKSETRRGDGRSSRRTRSVIDERMPDTSESTEARLPNLVLSPETSNALEDAEKIVCDAKMRLKKVCAMTRFDSTPCRNGNTFSDDPPLDDETEERFYVRQLVASKFREMNDRFTGLTANGRKCARLERFPEGNVQVTARGFVRKLNLSAPRFRTLPRRRLVANRASFVGRRGCDDQRSRECSSSVQVRSPRESSSKDDAPSEDERRDRTRDCRWRPSPSTAARRSELVDQRVNGNVRIQRGPCVHVNGELTRQDLEDVHISPDPSFAHDRANTAIYRLRHESRASGTADAEVSESPQVKLGTSRREKRGRLTVAEVFADAVTPDGSDDARKNVKDVPNNGNLDGGRESRFSVYVEEKKDRGSPVSRDVENVETPARSARVMNRAAADHAVPGSSGIGNEDRAEIIPRDREDGRISDKREDDIDNSVRSLDEENVVDVGIESEKRNDQSALPFDSDVRRRNGVPSRCPATENNSGPYRILDERCLSGAFNGHDAVQDEPCNDVGDMHGRTSVLLRSSVRADNLRAEDDARTIELYRPCLDELDSMLLSNERKIEHIARTADDIAALLSKPEFARYKLLDENKKRASRKADREESSAGESREKPNASPRSSILETELRNQDLSIVSSISETTRRSDTKSRATSATATITKTSCSAKESARPKNSSAEFGNWTASDGGGSSMDRSDIASFCDALPALSSTRAEATQMRRDKAIARTKDAIADRREDTWPRITSAGKRSERATDCSSPKRRTDDLLARIIRGWNKSETMDRFVACILQDEKQSVERKVTRALRESSVAPKMLQRLLREAVSIDDARRNTDTLNILKAILLDLSNRNDADVDDGGATEICVQNVASIARTEEESTPRERSHVKLDADEIVVQVVEDPRDSKNHELLVSAEHRESTRSATRSESVPRFRNSNEGSTRETQISNVPANIPDAVNGNDEVTGDGKEARFRDVVEPTKTPSPDAVEKSNSHKENAGRARPATGEASGVENSRVLERRDARPSSGLSEHRETQRSTRTAVASEFDRSSKNDSGSERNRSLSESLKQISEIGSDDEENPVGILSSSRIAAGRTSKREVMTDGNAGDAVGIETLGNKEDNEKEQGRADATYGSAVTRKDVDSVHSLAGGAEFPRPTYDGNADSPQRPASVVANKTIDTVSSRSADSLRDCASLHASSNGEPSEAKEVGPRNRETSFDIEPTKAGEDEIRVDGNRKGENGTSAASETAKRDEECRIVAAETPCDSSFNSVSSLNDAALDRDGRSNEDAFSANVKEIGTSPEISHSEGELYMPSSCSYSLGEVRILERCDLIADNSMDRDSSVTVLVTRSMLTSLNDSTTSLLGSSSRV